MNRPFAPAKVAGPALEPAGFESWIDDIAGEGEAIDPRAIWAAARRSRYLILGILAAAVVLAIVVTALTRPNYTAVASVQIEQQAAKVLGTEDVQPIAPLSDADRFLQTQIDILTSRGIAVRVASALGLQRNDQFAVRMGGKPIIPAPGLDVREARRERTIDLLRKGLKVALPRNSRVVGISFVSPDPALAANVANAFADAFIAANLQRRYDTSAYARGFLERRLNDVRQKLEQSDRAANDYARRARLIDASNAAPPSGGGNDNASSGPHSLTVAQLVQLNGAYGQAQTSRVAAEERWNQAQRTTLMSLPEVLQNGAIQTLSQQKAQLVAAYEEEKQRRKAEYPTMVQEAARIAELDRQITDLATSVRNSIRDAYLTARSQEQALGGDLARLKDATLTEQDRSVRYNILLREVDTNRALYDGLLQRYKEVSAQAGITTNNISIVDDAEPPRDPTSPRPLLNLAFALLLAGVASAGLVFAREKLDDVVRSAEDVPAKLGLPLLASIPVIAADRSPLEELEQPRSDLSEAYQGLRARLELSSSQGVPTPLLVTSSRPAEGKSTTAFAVARSFARLGSRVLLIDADLRRPSLHRVVGLSNEVGLSSLLAHQREIDAAIQQTAIDRLDCIASGPLPPSPAELLGTDVLADLLTELSGRYDLIVIDGPPVLGLADSVQLAGAVAGTLFVVEANAGHYGGVKASIRRIAASGQPIIGVVLNKFDIKRMGYGAGYAHNYAYRYGEPSS